jgi:hypothetical protein
VCLFGRLTLLLLLLLLLRCLQVAIVEAGGRAFSTVPLSSTQWAVCVGFGGLTLLLRQALRLVPTEPPPPSSPGGGSSSNGSGRRQQWQQWQQGAAAAAGAAVSAAAALPERGVRLVQEGAAAVGVRLTGGTAAAVGQRDASSQQRQPARR